jgi:hypothetical protein
VFCIQNVSAQQAFVVTGDDVSTGFGSVSYTVGQLVVESDTTKRGAVISGIQLPIELFKNPVSIDESVDGIIVEPFPNPTMENVKISIPTHCMGPFVISLIDITGSIKKKMIVQDHEHTIMLSNEPAGHYSILISQQDKVIASYSIIKH